MKNPVFTFAMNKTNKAVKKRFKISATGKVMSTRAGRRHLAGSKKSKKTRATRRWVNTHTTDTYRVISNLPFSH